MTTVIDCHPTEELAHKALRFLTAGSVDDGKSTLIGRLLFDSRAILAETATTTITERGATRMDDQTSEASMEQRKKEGYF